MINKEFGKRLGQYRQKAIDPITKRKLTQQRLGELLGMELGRSAYTGAAVSDWERGESRIDVDDRTLLLSLVKILFQQGGIHNRDEANSLLEAGNYRALNVEEAKRILPEEPSQAQPSPASNFQFLVGNTGGISPAEYGEILHKARQGPRPAWPRVAVSLLTRFTNPITHRHVLGAIAWGWTWLIAHLLMSPSLNWNLITGSQAVLSMGMYAVGSLILPPMIGALTNTNKSDFWRKQATVSQPILRLYVYQGAYVGFHAGYFLVFLLTPLQNLIGVQPANMSEFIKMGMPLLAGYAGAQLVPYNLWLAYRRLNLKDGGIFFVFIILGPLWACFFLAFYKSLASPVLGAIVILMAVTLAAVVQAVKSQKR